MKTRPKGIKINIKKQKKNKLEKDYCYVCGIYGLVDEISKKCSTC